MPTSRSAISPIARCQARDIFAYRSDDGRGANPDAGKIARRLAATLRKAVKRPAVAEGRRIKRAS